MDDVTGRRVIFWVPMGWMEERIAERARLSNESYQIGLAYDGIWKSLWEELIKQIEIYKTTYGPNSVLTTGGYDQRTIVVTEEVIGGVPHGAKKKTVYSQDPNRKAINADGLRFELKVCKDGVVCLVRKEKELTLEQAAMLILDPLLFSDLERLTV